VEIPNIDDATKKRWRRGFKRRRTEAAQMGQAADEQIERLLIRRFDRLISVRRFIFLWVGLFVLLIFCNLVQLRALSPYYQVLQPTRGGLYSEGMIGTFTNANPIYAAGTANQAVSRLVFSSLLKYDNNNNLVGDLAKSWDINDTQTKYTVHLNKGITWQDGKPFTADDVVFTYRTIQKPEAESPLYPGWKGINVSKIDANTVSFDLPNTYSAFPYSLTNGIIPAHILEKVPANQMRSAPFNTQPVGTGPFEWKFVEVTSNTTADREQRISLAANAKYHGGKPKLDGFSLVTFNDEQKLVNAFNKKQLNAMSGVESPAQKVSKDANVHVYSTPLTGEVMAFFNLSHPGLDNAASRQALVSAVDTKKLATKLDYPVRLAEGPLLKGQIGYDPTVTQLPYSLDKANQLLDGLGWTRNAAGQRMANNQPVQFILFSQDTPEYTKVAQFLQKQWSALGVKIVVNYRNSDDLERYVIPGHDYDILLYGVSIGVDPDVFAYWDSSQANPGSAGHLNLSEYKSKAADQALEGARTRSDTATRVVKYHNFLAAWTQDAPALALYQPNFLYVSNGPVFNYERKTTNTSADRFYNVTDWMVRQQRQNL
jgi:peptide/nickel transport system substrate-binding protein